MVHRGLPHLRSQRAFNSGGTAGFNLHRPTLLMYPMAMLWPSTGENPPQARAESTALQGLNAVSKSRVYSLKDRDPVGLSASRSVGLSKWTVLIGRTGFDTISSIPDPTLSLGRDGSRGEHGYTLWWMTW